MDELSLNEMNTKRVFGRASILFGLMQFTPLALPRAQGLPKYLNHAYAARTTVRLAICLAGSLVKK